MNLKSMAAGLALCLLPGIAGAQDEIPTHEIMVSVGTGTTNLGWDTGNNYDAAYWTRYEDPLLNYRWSSVYDKGTVQLPCFGLSYRKDFGRKHRLAYGFNVAYEPKHGSWKHRLTDETVYRMKDNYLSVLPMVRLYYKRRPGFRMYGELGVGGTLNVWQNGGEPDSHGRVLLTGQLTYLGFQWGHRLFGSVELGFGCLGLLRVGTGYRF